jgi:hypothetical protein
MRPHEVAVAKTGSSSGAQEAKFPANIWMASNIHYSTRQKKKRNTVYVIDCAWQLQPLARVFIGCSL